MRTLSWVQAVVCSGFLCAAACGGAQGQTINADLPDAPSGGTIADACNFAVQACITANPFEDSSSSGDAAVLAEPLPQTSNNNADT